MLNIFNTRRLQISETDPSGKQLFERGHLDVFTIGDIDVGRPRIVEC